MRHRTSLQPLGFFRALISASSDTWSYGPRWHGAVLAPPLARLASRTLWRTLATTSAQYGHSLVSARRL
jgi:hypothetical protein